MRILRGDESGIRCHVRTMRGTPTILSNAHESASIRIACAQCASYSPGHMPELSQVISSGKQILRILWCAFAGSSSPGHRSAATPAAAGGEDCAAVTFAAPCGSAATRSPFSTAVGGSSSSAPAGPSAAAAPCSSATAGNSKPSAVYAATYELP